MIRAAVLGDAAALVGMAREFADEHASLPVAPDAPTIPEPDDAEITEEAFGETSSLRRRWRTS